MRASFAFIALFIHFVGYGQFDVALPVHTVPNGPALRAFDMDADGDLDLVGLADGTMILIWSNLDGFGNFSEVDTLLVLPEAPLLHLVQDLNGDGAADLLFVTADGGRLAAAWNNGAGQLDTPSLISALSSTPGVLRTGDITGNGWPDVVVSFAENDQAGIAFWPNQGGLFSAEVRIEGLLAGNAPTVMAIGDLDASGGQDVFMIASDLAAVGLMNGNGDGSSWDVTTLFHNYDYPLIDPRLIDVDGDGDLDLAEANALAVQWMENRLNTPAANFSIQVLAPFTTAGRGQFAHLGCNGATGVVYVPSNPTLAVQWSHYLPSIEGFAPRKALPDLARGQHPQVADLNGDGLPDLLMVLANGAQWHPNSLTIPSTQVVVPQFDTLCIQGPSVLLPEALPTTGEWSGSWVQNGELFRSNAPGTMDLPLDYTLYEPQGCPVGERARMHLVSGPVVTTSLGPILCSAQRPLELRTLPQNVEWVGIPQNGFLDPTTFNGGVIVCAYTDPTGSSCVSFVGPIAVWPSVQASIQPAGPFCITSGTQTILPLVNLPGTTWSGDIVSSTNSASLFDPAQGAGEYTVILDRVPSIPQQCPNSDTLRITVVDDLPSVSVTPLPVYCSNGSPIPLSGGIPEGGTWSGPGVQNDALDPTLMGAGAQPVFYSFTNTSGCTADAVLFVELAADAVVQNTERSFCPEDDPMQFLALPAGGTWAAPLSISGSFSPALAGVGSHPLSYSYTDPNGCVLSNTPEDLVVSVPTFVEIDALPLYCLNTPPFMLIGSLSGIWSGAVNGTGSTVLFDPAALGIGTWNISLTVVPDDGCRGDTTIAIVVDACSGIEDDRSGTFATVAPNPFVDEFQLALDRSGSFSMRILDALGRTVQSTQFSTFGSSRITVDLAGRASGNYTVLLQHDATLQRLRVVKVDR